MEERMPFRTKETLEAWLAEFAELGYPISERLRVMPQEQASQW